jgi:tetratricopeptide (TPR) repeat protein
MVNQPGKEVLFAHFASNLLKSGALEEAIKVCEKGLKKFPTYAQAHYIVARCYIRKKLNNEARAELERVLRYEPNHVKAIRDLAGLHFANGFQDLYKEYLMQLFTLDPVNENVIQEAKKLGEYKLWSAENTPPVSPEPEVRPEMNLGGSNDKENVFIESEKEKTEESDSDTDSIFPDKIDLSQFDNVEDDFTTILHGKMEYSGKISKPLPNDTLDLVDIAKDIIEEPEIEEKTDSLKANDQPQTSTENVNQANSGHIQDDSPVVKPDNMTVEGSNNNSVQDGGLSDMDGQPGNISDDLISSAELADEESSNLSNYQDEEDDKFEQPKIISQTLGEILVSQQKYVEAKAVFEALKEKQPENKALDLKIEYLNRIIGLEKEGKS